MRRAALTVALALAAGPASAYVRTTTERGAALRWSSDCVTLNVHTAMPPPNLTPELFLSAAQRAAAAWSREMLSCTDMEITIQPVDDAGAPVQNDKQNNLMFRTKEWCKEPRDPGEPCYDQAALAITTVFAEQDSGRIVDTDIEVNGVTFTWGDLVAHVGTGGNAQDIQNTLTHEFGHMVGLDHNCWMPGQRTRPNDNLGHPVPDCSAATPEQRAATMYAAVIKGDVQRRTLSPDDVQGVCDVYPAGKGTCDSGGGGSGSGCALAGGGSGASLACVLGLGLLAIRARRRRRLRG